MNTYYVPLHKTDKNRLSLWRVCSSGEWAEDRQCATKIFNPQYVRTTETGGGREGGSVGANAWVVGKGLAEVTFGKHPKEVRE